MLCLLGGIGQSLTLEEEGRVFVDLVSMVDTILHDMGSCDLKFHFTNLTVCANLPSLSRVVVGEGGRR